jgi:hypothetical protein
LLTEITNGLISTSISPSKIVYARFSIEGGYHKGTNHAGWQCRRDVDPVARAGVLHTQENSGLRGAHECPWQRAWPQLHNDPMPQSPRTAPGPTTFHPERNPMLSLSLRGEWASSAPTRHGSDSPPLALDSDPFHSQCPTNSHTQARERRASATDYGWPPYCYRRLSVSNTPTAPPATR